MRLFIAAVALLATTASAQELRPTATEPLRDETILLIPAAGAIQGGGGTFFRSDIQIVNLRTDEPQQVELLWIPRGGSDAVVRRVVELLPLSGIGSEDFVTTVMQQSGLGSIMIRGIDQNGDPDPLAELNAVSRIWTPQPGTEGTTSQSFPAVPMRSLDERRLTIFGQRIDERYRSNVGIVNADPAAAHEFDIILVGVTTGGEAWGPFTDRVSLPAWSMQQYSLTDVPPLGMLQIEVAPVLEADETPRPWVAYASTVDNVTGDAWSHVGFATIEPISPTGFTASLDR